MAISPDQIYHLIDLIWLPVTWFAVHRHQRLKALAFVLACLVTLRTQVELMESLDHPYGFLPLMDSHVYARGLIIYSVVIMLFLLLAHYSPRTQKIVFFAASLSIYMIAVCASMVLMAL